MQMQKKLSASGGFVADPLTRAPPLTMLGAVSPHNRYKFAPRAHNVPSHTLTPELPVAAIVTK